MPLRPHRPATPFRSLPVRCPCPSVLQGPSVNVARLLGSSTTTFSGCVFVQWDYAKVGEPAIKAINGQLIVNVRRRAVVHACFAVVLHVFPWGSLRSDATPGQHF